jgi:hypothetical protein
MMNIPSQIISEVKKAVERGPIYVLVLAGTVLLVGIDPAEFYAPSKHILSPAEFITVNIVAGVLIIAAATLGLLSSIAAMRTLEQISATSSDANIRAIEALKGISSSNAVLQNEIANHVLALSKQASGQFNSPDGTPESTS